MNNLWCTNYSSVRTNTRFTVTFANTLEPDQARQKVWPDLDQTVLTL